MNHYEDLSWKLLYLHQQRYGAGAFQIESFNYFLEHTLPRIFLENPQITIRVENDIVYKIIFGQTYVDYPTCFDEERNLTPLYPHEARARNLTYESSVFVDILLQTITSGVLTQTEKFLKIEVIKIPMMLRSFKCNLTRAPHQLHNECPNDVGGYFIIKGKERVIVYQERMQYDHIFVHKSKDDKYAFAADIRSMSEETGHSVKTSCLIAANGRSIWFNLPYIKTLIPAGLLLAAYGKTVEQCKKYMGVLSPEMSKLLQYIACGQIENRNEALQIIAADYYNSNVDAVKQILTVELFPHISMFSVEEYVAVFSQMIRKVLLCYCHPSLRTIDDKDHLSSKRIECVGTLMFDVIRSLWKKTIVDIFVNTKKKPNIKMLGNKLLGISKYLRACFAKGIWGMQNNSYQRAGVCQLLTRISYMSTVSHLRRVMATPIKNGKRSVMRQLHPSHYGLLCSVSTPEGENAGLIKNAGLMTLVSPHISFLFLFPIIKKFRSLDENGTIPILLNGRLCGMTAAAKNFIEEFNTNMTTRAIQGASIIFDPIDQTICIFIDGGRLIRPVLTVENQQVKLIRDISVVEQSSWDDLVRRGYIKYIDSYEAEFSVIAMYPYELNENTSYDYCEIHPSFSLSYEASMIPFPDHNQSPRNIYESNMGKQAISINSYAFLQRFDKAMYVLDYYQRPLVSSKTCSILKIDDMPSGINLIVGIASLTGANQEDAMYFNRASIERGLLRRTCYRTISDEEKRFTNSFERVQYPSDDVRGKKLQYNYSKLDNDGIVRVGTYVTRNDVVIGKVITKTIKNGAVKKTILEDCSVAVKPNEEGVVDSVLVTIASQDLKIIKIRIRSVLIPEIGDKFTSRFAQKGTCGMIYDPEDMPFTADGIIPDIVINTHCIPSRMTISQLFETILGKETIRTGEEFDSAAFTNFSGGGFDIESSLLSRGFNEFNKGKEIMYCGKTGLPFKSRIFIGPTYYQTLSHLVKNKTHARSHGDVQILTRQPLEGRSRDGGLRFGEMEQNCLAAHGMTFMLLDRMMFASDAFKIYVCSKCRTISNNPSFCAACQNDDVRITNIPYATKLLFLYLAAAGIKTLLTCEYK